MQLVVGQAVAADFPALRQRPEVAAVAVAVRPTRASSCQRLFYLTYFIVLRAWVVQAATPGLRVVLELTLMFHPART